MFAEGEVHKTYWAIVPRIQERENSRDWTTLEHWLVRNEQQNKSYAYDHEVPRSKKAVLRYRAIGQSEHYTLVEVQLLTGRHHQIRCQLAAVGLPIKGDLKYGAKRSNPDGSISLLSHQVEFIHPVSKEKIVVTSPLPDENLWQSFKKLSIDN
jgi:23S rRNA pseudouridine1911/1915/1917 synthase